MWLPGIQMRILPLQFQNVVSKLKKIKLLDVPLQFQNVVPNWKNLNCWMWSKPSKLSRSQGLKFRPILISCIYHIKFWDSRYAIYWYCQYDIQYDMLDIVDSSTISDWLIPILTFWTLLETKFLVFLIKALVVILSFKSSSDHKAWSKGPFKIVKILKGIKFVPRFHTYFLSCSPKTFRCGILAIVIKVGWFTRYLGWSRLPPIQAGWINRWYRG